MIVEYRITGYVGRDPIGLFSAVREAYVIYTGMSVGLIAFEEGGGCRRLFLFPDGHVAAPRTVKPKHRNLQRTSISICFGPTYARLAVDVRKPIGKGFFERLPGPYHVLAQPWQPRPILPKTLR